MKFDIPIYRPDLRGNEAKYVMECLETSWISSRGEYVDEFEKSFANRVESKFAASACNGTAALHLALLALGVGPGDEVIVPTFTYIASVNAIYYTGAKPVFCDSLASSWQMDPDDVERHISAKTKAIMVVHLYGQSADMKQLSRIAQTNSIMIVEDCAEAFGTYYDSRHVGTFGDIAAYSFFGNKTVTTGEGGMVVTSDPTLHDRVVRLKGQGLAKYREYWHDMVGYNYRMTNIEAAIGLAQLERADEFLASKRALATRYREALEGLPMVAHQEQPETTHSYWMVSLLLEDYEHRDSLREHLSANGIETRPLFYPVHTMPMYSSNYRRHPVAEDLARRGMNLPSWPGLSDQEFECVTGSIHSYFSHAN